MTSGVIGITLLTSVITGCIRRPTASAKRKPRSPLAAGTGVPDGAISGKPRERLAFAPLQLLHDRLRLALERCCYVSEDCCRILQLDRYSL